MIDAPAKFPDGTQPGNAQAFLPGDIIALDTRCLAPELAMFGARVGAVLHASMALSPLLKGNVLVRLPGFLDPFEVPLASVTLLYRTKPEVP